MNHAFGCRVALEFGSRRRVVDVADLAQALGLPGQEAKILSALFTAARPDPVGSPSGEREPTESFPLSAPEGTNNVNERVDISSSFSCPLPGKGGEPEGNHRGQEAERLAAYVADRLNDWKSHRFFLATARRVPREVILDALARAIDIPQADVRRSRAAYFTAVIRSYVATPR
jgi:hypothetical protein